MKKLLLGLFSIISVPSFAQTYLMNNNTAVTACAGNFYDSGGVEGNYALNQNFTKTFYPSTAGASIRFDFTAFEMEDQSDILFVYDGDNITAPLIGGFTGDNLPPILQASGSNTSGALTFKFLSDGQISGGGWAATVSCQVPCQNIQSVLISTVPEADQSDGLIKICPGTTVQLNGDAVFSDSGEGATYVWRIGDVEISGKNISYTFVNGGAYMINLRVTDAFGCINTNSLNRVIQTSFEPVVTFNVETAEFNALAVEASIDQTAYSLDCTPSDPGVTFLPDGSGASYQSSLYIDCYDASQVLSNGSQLLGICLNMEHSYLGDLNIVLVSPNGQSVVLKSYPGSGGTWLGIPIDDDSNLNAGTGSEYCFTMDATTTMVNGATIFVTDPVLNNVGSSLVPGAYLPEGNFNSLIGSPLNGTWTILVTDNLGIDNGFIFDWTLDFTPELLPTSLSFQTEIMQRGWIPEDSIIEQDEATVLVGSAEAGQQCFTYFVTDNFGCTYYYEQCVQLEALATADFSGSAAVKIFPSPATNAFGISGLEDFDSSAVIRITDISGKVLKNYEKQETYDVSDLQSGVYFVSVSDAERNIVKRLIKS